MEIPEIRERLEEALKVRIPMFDPSAPPREKINKLEEHIRDCAYHVGQCEEALHWVIEIGKRLRADWDRVEGYESMLRGNATKATKAQVDDAKRTINPGTWDALEETRALHESLKRQINRLGGTSYDAASRSYTLLSGS